MSIRFDRLKRLADHLSHGKLGHKEFQFDVWNSEAPRYKCGFAGCALGEMPIISRVWYFNREGLPSLKRINSSIVSAEFYFGLNERHVKHLFIPKNQLRRLGRHLGKKATRHQVASNIYAYIKIMSKV